ncbi:unnamed protein product [Ascophyllum nodosum]
MEQPSWMQNTGQESAPGNLSGGASSQQYVARGSGGDATIIRSFFHFINIGISVMMAASAVFGILALDNVQRVVLSVYLLIFSALMFLYELVRVLTRCERAHQVMRKNFGFFFGAKGRGLYLIFVGFLNWPLTSLLSTWTTFLTIGWGVITVLAYMSRPEWFEVPKQTSSTGGS